jgi:hypothetical protein
MVSIITSIGSDTTPWIFFTRVKVCDTDDKGGFALAFLLQ